MSDTQEFAQGREVLLYTDENGHWIAEVPSLYGCISDGRTGEEALERVNQAIDLWIEAATAHYEEIPENFDPGMSELVWADLPRFLGRECIKALLKIGFFVDRQKGTHIILYRENPYTKVIVPENWELPAGTLRAVIKYAGLSADDFIQLL